MAVFLNLSAKFAYFIFLLALCDNRTHPWKDTETNLLTASVGLRIGEELFANEVKVSRAAAINKPRQSPPSRKRMVAAKTRYT